MKKFLAILITCSLLIPVVSCKKNTPTDTFDKTALFTNYADNLILPAYTSYGSELTALESAFTAFNSSPDTAGLANVQQAILDAYEAWQSCEIYEMTEPADAVQAHLNTNFFPADTGAILANIQANNNSTAFIQTATYTHKGFPALEFLFFSRVLSRAQLLERFTSNVNAASFKSYAASLASDIRRVQSSILNDWSAYRNIFISAVGTDAGSSFSAMVNTISLRADNLKRHQVGIPAGYVGNTPTVTLFPAKVQAYYSNQSIAFMLITLDNMKDVMEGKSGIGLYDYLKHLGSTSTIGGNLADDIMSQIELCRQKATACGPDLAATIDNDKAKADALFLETKKLLVLLKVDMPSAIGVSISYSDNDGD